MRHINISEFTPPNNWLKKAEKIKAKLNTLPDIEAKKKYIDQCAHVWAALKQDLLVLSNGKCWYCEAKEDRSDYHVDHFRPKKRVMLLDGTACDGYWWLAFDWTNYRIACSYCNSPHTGEDGIARGKSDSFPLRDERFRAKVPEDNRHYPDLRMT